MSKLAKFISGAVIVLLILLGAVSNCNRLCRWLSVEKPPATPEPTATPTPTPKPTPIYIPQKRLEISKLFNGMEVHTKLETEPGSTATIERETPDSYGLEVNVKVKVPKPNVDLASLSKLNPALPKLLPGLAQMLETARVSEKYEALYGRKLAELQHNLPRFDALLSRHNFFDCETILELRDPKTHRTVVLLQADMDVDTDGSDPDRLPAVDPSDPTFQPMTNYRWPKQTILMNPFLPSRQAKLQSLEAELAKSKHLGGQRVQNLREAVASAQYEVNQLKSYSFLIAATDPYVVLPGLMYDGMDPAFQPRVGDYCAVIHGNTIYPAIVGDVGPRDLVGEASLRLGKEINSETTALHRAESNLKVTYLFFPNTADKPFGPPDLPNWHAKIEALLSEIGGYDGTIHTWTNLSKPVPTPTPTPTPSLIPSGNPTPETTPASTLPSSELNKPASTPSLPEVSSGLNHPLETPNPIPSNTVMLRQTNP